MAIPTMGESWHGNHHAFPSSARHGLYPGQIDLGYRFIQLLQLLGLAWNVKLPASLPPRPGITPTTGRALSIAAPGQAELCARRDRRLSREAALGLLARQGEYCAAAKLDLPGRAPHRSFPQLRMAAASAPRA